MRRALILSLAIHLIAAGLLIWTFSSSKSLEWESGTVRIRIAPRLDQTLPLQRETHPVPVEPSETRRIGRQEITATRNPGERAGDWDAMEPSRNRESALGLSGLPNPSRRSIGETPEPNLSFDELDPLAGFTLPDSNVVSGREASSTGLWSLAWDSGHQRDIVYYPVFEVDAVSGDVERVSEVSISVGVTPEGLVSWAEVESPGSGDARLDRYLHSLAITFVFSPRPSQEAMQIGRIRLRFQGQESDG